MPPKHNFVDNTDEQCMSDQENKPANNQAPPIRKGILPADSDIEEEPLIPHCSPKRILSVSEVPSVRSKFEALKKEKQMHRQRNTPRGVTAIKRLNETTMQEVANKCRDCTAEKRCCSQLNFAVVRHVRSILYGPTMNQTKRRKTIMSWLAQIQKMSTEKRTKENKNSCGSECVRSYFVFDFSFSQNESEIEAIPCCKNCFTRVLGLSTGSLLKYWKELKTSDMKVEEAAACAEKGFEKSPERLACHAWMEYFVAQQSCKSPDHHKSELASVTTVKDMHDMFSQDWKEGVMSGTNYRKHRGSGKRGRRVPVDAVEPKPVDEDGAFEASDAVKDKLLAKHSPPSYSFFCKVWKSDFSGDYKIPRHHRRFTQCNWCAELKANLKHAADSEDRLYYKRCLYDHYKWITEQRQKYYKHRKKAEMHPSK